jgi:hypothetical protein
VLGGILSERTIMDQLNQKIGVVAQLEPAAARAVSSYYTSAIDSNLYTNLLALVQIGTLAGSGTVNARFQHCSVSASGDAGWADVSSASCITSTFTSASNAKVGELELLLREQPRTSRFVRIMTVNATSTWIGGVVVLGDPKYKPATDRDTADVVQTVVF